MKKVAYILYGQPRYYSDGSIKIFNFLSKQNNIDIDFFYHCWIIDEYQKYPASPWRNITDNELSYQENIKENLIENYNPVAYEYEKQIFAFDKSLYINSIAYKNNNNIRTINNINNTISVQYSRNKARNLFEDYVNKTNTKYDFVIFSRFDIQRMPDLKLADLDCSKVNISNNYKPRILFNPALIILPQDIFIKWFDVFDKLKEFNNDNNINEYLKTNGEFFSLNDEELLIAKYIYTFKTIENLSSQYYW